MISSYKISRVWNVLKKKDNEIIMSNECMNKIKVL